MRSEQASQEKTFDFRDLYTTVKVGIERSFKMQG
jgi:hypothetical protein